jgi:hypothetical protein
MHLSECRSTIFLHDTILPLEKGQWIEFCLFHGFFATLIPKNHSKKPKMWFFNNRLDRIKECLMKTVIRTCADEEILLDVNARATGLLSAARTISRKVRCEDHDVDESKLICRDRRLGVETHQVVHAGSSADDTATH